jgi:hypothetical protein
LQVIGPTTHVSPTLLALLSLQNWFDLHNTPLAVAVAAKSTKSPPEVDPVECLSNVTRDLSPQIRVLESQAAHVPGEESYSSPSAQASSVV